MVRKLPHLCQQYFARGFAQRMVGPEKAYIKRLLFHRLFFLSKTFNENGIEVISNKHWLQKGDDLGQYGEQPVDVAYTIITLSKFYDVFHDEQYRLKMEMAFNWFLGKNRLNQIIYNPCTGGCFDGLEEHNVNLNQGAESTLSYLLARLTVDKYKNEAQRKGVLNTNTKLFKEILANKSLIQWNTKIGQRMLL
jgi:hypothetical protein